MPDAKPAHADICRAAIEAICAAGGAAWTNPTGVGYTKRGTPLRYGLCSGSPDIVGDLHGYAIYVDAKRPADRLSAQQRAFLDAAAERGCYAIELRNPDIFREWLRENPQPTHRRERV